MTSPFKHTTDTSIQHIDIYQIAPDKQQPRRTVPSDVRCHWDGSADTVADMLRQWHEMASDEALHDIDLMRFVNTPPDDNAEQRELPFGCVGHMLVKLLTLAASIRYDGLVNPITVAFSDDGYLLETGERRWLAYHLLHMLFPDEKAWTTVPAEVVEKANLWRQAGENNARENLNAVGKARQVALLLMDLHREAGNRKHFRALETFSHERHYYAQITHKPYHRVPRGKSERLLAATNLKHSRQISHYRALLKLPDKAWDIADDYNLSERSLRIIVCNHELSDAEKLQRVRRLANRSLKSSVEKSPSDPQSQSDKLVLPGTKRYFNQLISVLETANPKDPETSENALKRLDELEQWIRHERTKLKTYLNIYERNNPPLKRASGGDSR